MSEVPLQDPTHRQPVQGQKGKVRGGEACLLIRKLDHSTPTREIKRHVRALARNHPEGWRLQGNVSPTMTNYLTYGYRYGGWRSVVSMLTTNILRTSAKREKMRLIT